VSDPSPEYYRAVAKRAWLLTIVTSGLVLLVLTALATALGVLLIFMIIGGAA
jgi:hypothetical protein